jgi:hypothetical protein
VIPQLVAKFEDMSPQALSLGASLSVVQLKEDLSALQQALGMPVAALPSGGESW